MVVQNVCQYVPLSAKVFEKYFAMIDWNLTLYDHSNIMILILSGLVRFTRSVSAKTSFIDYASIPSVSPILSLERFVYYNVA
ncbi:hypothetical protein L873DRAFT_1822672 [Choiromyces venosus 120613-1]|uniref:Uncharacterized protein n=1 Tax=Choiromyces venosus 120613-1 TaxID=1336337 RepID=A0A3N4IUQ3_9PEZI|nr:hypothetical protein L873DRAFT_1822672 [Choiromyces venosus 120613-1]